MSPETIRFFEWCSTWLGQALATAIGGSIAAWVALTVAKRNAVAALETQQHKAKLDRELDEAKVARKDAGLRRQVKALLFGIAPYFRAALGGTTDIPGLRQRYATLRPKIYDLVAAETVDDVESGLLSLVLDSFEQADGLLSLVERHGAIVPLNIAKVRADAGFNDSDVPNERTRKEWQLLQARVDVSVVAERVTKVLKDVLEYYDHKDEAMLFDDAPRYDWRPLVLAPPEL
jgi:hypothetical protein